MKIRKENQMKNMKIIGTFENHMNMNYNHKIKSYEKITIIKNKERHMKRKETHKRKSFEQKRKS